MKPQHTLSPPAQEFIDGVLGLKPAVAVFDCDGTLWNGDSGADFFYWEVEQKLLPHHVVDWALARYDDYKLGKVDETTMCGEIVTIHDRLSESRLEEAAREFFSAVVQPRIFPEMLQLTRELRAQGCELWAVSSTNVWVVREGVKQFGIAPERVLGACVHIEDGLATSRLHRVPSGPGKATAINEVLGRTVDACFGNSIHDLDMLKIARNPFAVNPNPDLERIAQQKSWQIYWPEGTRK